MNRYCHVILFIFQFIVAPLFGQSIVPINIKHAIDKGYRTGIGIPGENYFQNESHYKILVRFDPKRGRLSGSADITYYNNSPDTLRKVVLRLYQNIARKGGIRDEEWEASNIHKGVEISALKVGNTNLMDNLNNRTRTSGTNFVVYLPELLSPRDSIKIEIGWNFDMPGSAVHRYGKYGEGTYFVSLWYPQIAVFDDLFGWDEIPYDGLHEFYSPFADYDGKRIVF